MQANLTPETPKKRPWQMSFTVPLDPSVKRRKKFQVCQVCLNFWWLDMGAQLSDPCWRIQVYITINYNHIYQGSVDSIWSIP